MEAGADWHLTYSYILNVDPATGKPTGLEPGYIAVTVRAGGEVVGHFTPAPIPAAGRGEESYAMSVSRERAEKLRGLFAASGLERATPPPELRMGDGEPVAIGFGAGSQAAAMKVLPVARLPREARPFLAEMTALVRELLGHVKR
jgi:hypothetical protein